MIKKILFLIFILFSLNLNAKVVQPVSKTLFKILDDNGNLIQEVDLKGQEFIVVSVREPGSDGRFYAVDRDGVVWWTGIITSGADDYKNPYYLHRFLRDMLLTYGIFFYEEPYKFRLEFYNRPHPKL